MVKQITAYQAEDGSIHTDACSAARRDLEAIVAASPLAENQPYAKKLVEWLTDRNDAILFVLNQYNVACPNGSRGEALPETPKGPAVKAAEIQRQATESGHPRNCGAYNGFDCDCGLEGRESSFTDVPSGFGDV